MRVPTLSSSILLLGALAAASCRAQQAPEQQPQQQPEEVITTSRAMAKMGKQLQQAMPVPEPAAPVEPAAASSRWVEGGVKSRPSVPWAWLGSARGVYAGGGSSATAYTPTRTFPPPATHTPNQNSNLRGSSVMDKADAAAAAVATPAALPTAVNTTTKSAYMDTYICMEKSTALLVPLLAGPAGPAGPAGGLAAGSRSHTTLTFPPRHTHTRTNKTQRTRPSGRCSTPTATRARSGAWGAHAVCCVLCAVCQTHSTPTHISKRSND